MDNKKDNNDQPVEELVPLETIFGDMAEKARKKLKEGMTKLRPLTKEENNSWLQGDLPTTCIQCGICCFQYEVNGVPGYRENIKPSCEECRYNTHPSLKEGKWTISRCQLYPHWPSACAKYNGNASPYLYEKLDKNGNLSKEIPCAEGVMYWLKLLRIYGGKLPEEVECFFPVLPEKKSTVC